MFRRRRLDPPSAPPGSNRQFLLTVILSCLAMAAPAQEALRMSLASADAARARRESMTTIGYYNLRVGPTAWRFSSGLGFEWNDNVRNSGIDPRSDFIISPGLNAQLLWPLTDRNVLNLRLGAGYSAYVQNSGLSRFYVDPGSELSFDIYTGNIRINLHDRFSINQYSYQDPTIAGSDYSRLENAAGLGVLWDMNKVILRAGYDHINYVTITGSLGQPDGVSEVLYSTLGYKVADQWVAGLEAGGGLITYNDPFYPNASQWNVGVFSEARITEYISARGSAGYTMYSPEQGGGSSFAGDMSGFYFQLGIAHRLNKYFSHTLTAGRSINFAFYGGTVDRTYVQWSGSWNLIKKTTLGTTLDYQTGEELSYGREEFDWFGGGISLSRQLMRKLSGSLYYRGYWRESNLAGRNYVVNAVGMQFRYDF